MTALVDDTIATRRAILRIAGKLLLLKRSILRVKEDTLNYYFRFLYVIALIMYSLILDNSTSLSEYRVSSIRGRASISKL